MDLLREFRQFPETVFLLCFIHLQRTLDAKRNTYLFLVIPAYRARDSFLVRFGECQKLGKCPSFNSLDLAF